MPATTTAEIVDFREEPSCLIDRNHHVAELYNMVNVPQATWIDEEGRIVRPPENAGSSDAFRQMDRTTKQMSPAQIAERNRTKQTYLAAVHDWVLKGSASEFAYEAAASRARLRLPDDAVARAHDAGVDALIVQDMRHC